jgi:rhodanese-related sulfurtransferase
MIRLPRRRLFLALLAALLSTSAATLRSAEFAEEPLAVVKQRVAKGEAVLVDVRSRKEWNQGRLAGAVFLPITSLDDEDFDFAKLEKSLSKKKLLYTYCVMGIRAEGAAEILAEHGYQVRVLKLGYEQLVKAGFKKAARKRKIETSATSR